MNLVKVGEVGLIARAIDVEDVEYVVKERVCPFSVEVNNDLRARDSFAEAGSYTTTRTGRTGIISAAWERVMTDGIEGFLL